MATPGAPASSPDFTAKPFGSPEMMKAMQEMSAVFEDDVTQALDSLHRLDLPHDVGPRPSRDGRTLHGRHADLSGDARIISISFPISEGSAGPAACWCWETGNWIPRPITTACLPMRRHLARKYTCCGSASEPRNRRRMRAGLLRLHTSLQDADIQHVFYESPGTDHEWQTWRRDLKDFAPRLF